VDSEVVARSLSLCDVVRVEIDPLRFGTCLRLIRRSKFVILIVGLTVVLMHLLIWGVIVVFLGPNYHVQISRLFLVDAIGVYTPCLTPPVVFICLGFDPLRYKKK
jgi:hypothetical protein